MVCYQFDDDSKSLPWENGWKSPFPSFKKFVVLGSRWPCSKLHILQRPEWRLWRFFTRIFCWKRGSRGSKLSGIPCTLRKITPSENNYLLLGGSHQLGRGYCSNPPFISHETAIWKGSHNPLTRGLTITMVISQLLTGMKASGSGCQVIGVSNSILRRCARIPTWMSQEVSKWLVSGL